LLVNLALLDPDHQHSSNAVWRIRDVYPGSLFFPIPHPGSKNSNKREVKKKFILFLRSQISQKTEYYVIVEMLKKKIWANIQRIVKFYPKNFNMLSNIWVWDPGSRGQKGTGSRIRNTGQMYLIRGLNTTDRKAADCF
jgi:hypothetical protein